MKQTMGYRVDDAVKYGVSEAVLLEHIRQRIEHNKTDKTFYKHGRYWYCCSKKSIISELPFWTERQVRTLLTNLINAGAIIAENLNDDRRDKTLWYSLTVE